MSTIIVVFTHRWTRPDNTFAVFIIAASLASVAPRANDWAFASKAKAAAQPVLHLAGSPGTRLRTRLAKESREKIAAKAGRAGGDTACDAFTLVKRSLHAKRVAPYYIAPRSRANYLSAVSRPVQTTSMWREDFQRTQVLRLCVLARVYADNFCWIVYIAHQ